MRASGKVVVAILIGAIAFGLFIGYLAYTNALFPQKQASFGNYATVVSTYFNGTEVAFNVRWDNASALPLKVQLTSTVSTQADSPVCMAGLSSVTSGQMLFLPFAVSPPLGDARERRPVHCGQGFGHREPVHYHLQPAQHHRGQCDHHPHRPHLRTPTWDERLNGPSSPFDQEPGCPTAAACVEPRGYPVPRGRSERAQSD